MGGLEVGGPGQPQPLVHDSSDDKASGQRKRPTAAAAPARRDVHAHPEPSTPPLLAQILKVIPRERRTQLFSATMTSKVQKLQRACLEKPVKIEVRLPLLPCMRIATGCHAGRGHGHRNSSISNSHGISSPRSSSSGSRPRSSSSISSSCSTVLQSRCPCAARRGQRRWRKSTAQWTRFVSSTASCRPSTKTPTWHTWSTS